MTLIIPEYLILNKINQLLDYIQYEIETLPESETLIYDYFYKLGNIDGKSYYRVAKDIFSRDNSDKRKLETRLFFDINRAEIPSIHISLPNELRGPTEGIGLNEGAQDNILFNNGTKYSKTKRASYDSNYTLIITSSNKTEVLIIYHTIKALLTSVQENLEQEGFQNLKISGGDLDINPDRVPKHFFAREIQMSGFYENIIKNPFKEDLIAQIFANGTATEES